MMFEFFLNLAWEEKGLSWGIEGWDIYGYFGGNMFVDYLSLKKVEGLILLRNNCENMKVNVIENVVWDVWNESEKWSRM